VDRLLATTPRPEQNLGLNLALHMTKNLSLRLQANNLTNEPLRLTQNNDDLDVRRFDAYGRTFLLDLTFKLDDVWAGGRQGRRFGLKTARPAPAMSWRRWSEA